MKFKTHNNEPNPPLRNIHLENKRKSICFLTDVLMIGGVERVLLDSLEALSQKYDISIISLYYEPQKTILEQLPVNVKVIYKQMSKNKLALFLGNIPFLSTFYFNRAIEKNYDYLIALKPDVMNLCYSTKGTFKIYWCHNDYHTKYANKDTLTFIDRVKAKILASTLKKHDMIWTVSEKIGEDMRDAFSIDNVFAVPNPIDCTSIIEKSNKVCDVIFSNKKANIVTVGRLSQEKGIDRIIRIMADPEIREKANAHLYIIGDGGMRDDLEKLIDEYGLDSNITLLGAKSNPFPYLRQAQLYICPSRVESFGLSIMEAMLLKIPVITTATSGGKYVTQCGKLACCVDNEDDILRSAVLEFLNNPKEYTYSFASAKEWVLEHDLPIFRSKIVQLLDSLQSPE